MRPTHLKSAAELAANKPHGIRIKYMGGCRCADCRRANTKYELRRAVLRATQRGSHLVPADPARKYLKFLSRHHLGRRRVAQLAQISPTVLALIKNGQRQQIRATTERRILRVTPDLARTIPAGPTWKLINLLIEEGFTKSSLARKLGYKSSAIQIRQSRVTADNARRVKQLYDEIELGADFGLELR